MKSVIHFSRHRRQGFRFLKAWELAAMGNFAVRLAVAALVAMLVLALLGMTDEAIEQAEYRGRAAKAEHRAEEIKRAVEEARRAYQKAREADERTVAAMNEKALIDSDTGDAFFFQVSKQKGL